MSGTYQVVFTRAARRAPEQDVPEKVAAAFESIVGALRENPLRVGTPLREPLAPLSSARRGEYRVLYRVMEKRLLIEVVSVTHRRDAYHRGSRPPCASTPHETARNPKPDPLPTRHARRHDPA